MAKRLDTLTDEHRALIPAHVAEWIAIGRATEPADRPLAEASIANCYVHSKLLVPPVFVWCDTPTVVSIAGPLAGALVEWLLDSPDDVAKTVRQAGSKRPPADVKAVLAAKPLRPDVAAAIQKALSFYNSDAAILDFLLLRAAHEFATGNIVSKNWCSYTGGQFWAAVPARASFCAEKCGLELEPDIEARRVDYANFVKSSAWGWLHQSFAMLCDRPRALKIIDRDGSSVLHCETGPAVAWRGVDTDDIYALRGVVVPCDWITGTPDPKLAFTHPDVEQRRVLREFLGWKNILDAFPVKVINQDPSKTVGALIECDLGDDNGKPARFLRAFDPNRGVDIVERVPPACETALEAQNHRWFGDRHADLYAPVLET